jgi:hypothetical protein
LNHFGKRPAREDIFASRVNVMTKQMKGFILKFIKYDKLESFCADTLEILLEDEIQNNLPLSFIYNERGCDTSNWLLASIGEWTSGIAGA